MRLRPTLADLQASIEPYFVNAIESLLNVNEGLRWTAEDLGSYLTQAPAGECKHVVLDTCKFDTRNGSMAS